MKNAFTAASATQNNLRKGEEVLPIARALYLQGLVEQLTLDVEKLKATANQHSTKLRDVIRSGINKYHTDLSSVSIENLAAVITHNYSQVAQGKTNIIDVNDPSQRDIARFKSRYQQDSDQNNDIESVHLQSESVVQQVPDKRLIEVIDRLNFDVSLNARRFKDENERLRLDLSRIVADNADIKMQLLHLEGSIKSLTMQSIRMDSRGRQVTESLLQEERIKSFDREFNIIDRRILKSANMSVETAAADFDLSKRLTSPAMPQRIVSPKCVPRDSRRPPIRRHSLQDSIPTTPIHALVTELEQEQHFVDDFLRHVPLSRSDTSQTLELPIVEKSTDMTARPSSPNEESSVYITSDTAMLTIAPETRNLNPLLTSAFSDMLCEPADDQPVGDKAGQASDSSEKTESVALPANSLTLRDQIGLIFQENVNAVRNIRETSKSISSWCMRTVLNKIDAVSLTYDDSNNGSSKWSSQHSYVEYQHPIAMVEPSFAALHLTAAVEDRASQTDLIKENRAAGPDDAGADSRESELHSFSKALHILLNSMEGKFCSEIGNESFINVLLKLAKWIEHRSLDPLIRPKSRSLSPTEIKIKIPPPPSPAEDSEDFVSPHSDSKDEEKCHVQPPLAAPLSLLEPNSSLASRIESSSASVIQLPVDAIDGGIVYLPDFEGITFPAKAPVLPSSAVLNAVDLKPSVVEEAAQIGELTTIDLGSKITLPIVTAARSGPTPSKKVVSNRQKESASMRRSSPFDNRKVPGQLLLSSATHNSTPSDKVPVSSQDIIQASRKSPSHWSTKPRSAAANGDRVGADEFEYYNINGAKLPFDESEIPEPEADDQSISIESEKSRTHVLMDLSRPSPKETVSLSPGQLDQIHSQSHAYSQTEQQPQQQQQEVSNIVYHFESINREAILNDVIEYLDKKCSDLEQLIKASTQRSQELEISFNTAREEWQSMFLAQKENQYNDTSTIMHSLMHKIQEVEISIDSQVRETQAPWLIVLEAAQNRSEQAEAISLQALEMVTKLNDQKQSLGPLKESLPSPDRDAVKQAVHAVLAPDLSRNPNRTPSFGHVHSAKLGVDALTISLTPQQRFPDIMHPNQSNINNATITQPPAATSAPWLLSESEVDQLLRRLRGFAGNYDDLSDRVSTLSETIDKRLATVEKKLSHTHAHKINSAPFPVTVPKPTGPVKQTLGERGDDSADVNGHADIALIKQDLAMIWLRLQDMPPNQQRVTLDGKVPSATTSSINPVGRPNPPSTMPSSSILGTSFRKFR